MIAKNPLRVVFLGSGSSGNAAVVTDGATTVMIDCGFSAREVSRRMSSVGIDAQSVSALFVTHEHTDHVRGIDVFARRHARDCTVYATRGTRDAARLEGGGADFQAIRAGEPVRVGTLEILAFCTSHDAAEPVGYRITGDDTAVGIATDTGVLTAEAEEALRDVDILCLESNHDVRMLETGPYPPFLKRRIGSTDGHLSNAAAASALERLASSRMTQVFGLHRSRTNNTAALAAEALQAAATRIGLSARVAVASQHQPSDSHPPQAALFPEGGR